MPSTVSGVQVTNLLSGFRFLVEWDLNNGGEVVTAYKVFRSPNQGHGYSLVATITSPGFQYVDKVPFTYGAVFYYKVIAINASGIMGDITQAEAVTDETFDDFDEKPFRSVAIGPDSFVFNEIPGGPLDNTNFTFTTAQYFRAGTLQVYIDGMRVQPTKVYTEGADQKSFTLVATAPTPGSVNPILAISNSSGLWPPSAPNDFIMVDYLAL